MNKLQRWMNKHQMNDAQVAQSVKLARTQVSRIRRGITGTTPATALRLEALTGIRWWNFIEAGGGKTKAKVSR